MNIHIPVFAALAIGFIAQSSMAQDQDAAAERARLANQRILAEAELRAREEQAHEEEQQRAAVRSIAQPATVSTATTAVSTAPEQAPAVAPPQSAVSAGNVRGSAQTKASGSPGMSLALDQVRTLGELRDAGYVTEAEFERIKRRILEDAL